MQFTFESFKTSLNRFLLKIKNKIKSSSFYFILTKLNYSINNFTSSKFFRYKHFFQNKMCLEIGGPSLIFSKYHKFPIYEVVKSIDNINFSGDTVWGKYKGGRTYRFSSKKKPGMQYFFDSDDNHSKLNEESYDIIISSHVLEHLANPIKTLYKWKSLLKCGGILCLVVPHKDYTFDWKREITSIEHLIRDYKLDIGEDDTTHFQEVIDLHDIKMDSNVLDQKDHYKRTLNNYNLRVVHHHTFNIKSVEILCDYVGLNKIDSFFIKPYNIFYLAKKII